MAMADRLVELGGLGGIKSGPANEGRKYGQGRERDSERRGGDCGDGPSVTLMKMMRQ